MIAQPLVPPASAPAGSEAPIRVAHLVPALRRCGPVNVVLEVVSASRAPDVTYEILHLDSPAQLVAPCPSQPFSLSRQLLKRFDVLHAHCIRPEFYAFLGKVAAFRSIPLVTTIHGTSDEDYAFQFGKLRGWWIIRGEALLWRAFSARIVLGRYAEHHYRSRFSMLANAGFDVVSNGFTPPVDTRPDRAVLDALRDAPSDAVRIGVAAGLINRKGIEQVVMALADEPRFHLFLFGDGPERPRLEQLARQLGVAGRVRFLGFVSAPYTYASELDVYCLPSRSEGQPMTLIEGMAFGANVVVSDIPAHRDMFTPEEVTLFTLDDIASLRRAIWVAVAAMPERRRAATRAFHERFEAATMARKYEDVYRRVCRRS